MSCNHPMLPRKLPVIGVASIPRDKALLSFHPIVRLPCEGHIKFKYVITWHVKQY